MGESGARRWIGNTNQMLAAGALNLPTGILSFAFQGLVTVGAIKLEFRRRHKLYPLLAQRP